MGKLLTLVAVAFGAACHNLPPDHAAACEDHPDCIVPFDTFNDECDAGCVSAEEACERESDCLTGSGSSTECDGGCVEHRTCCDCLGDLDCLVIPESRCVDNLDLGGEVRVNDPECFADQALCGTVCGFLSNAD